MQARCCYGDLPHSTLPWLWQAVAECRQSWLLAAPDYHCDDEMTDYIDPPTL